MVSAREIPDSHPVWARVGWATIATPGDRIIGQAIDTWGPEGALDQMWRARGHRLIINHAALLDADPSDIIDFHRRYPTAPSPGGIAAVRQRCRELDISLIWPGSADWPEVLGDLGPHQPVVIFARGESGTLSADAALGVVGSRNPTPQGTRQCELLVADAAACGYTIVSGGARGIDQTAHRTARTHGAPQVMVLATALDRVASWQPELMSGVVENGVVISETPPGFSITRASFLHRNRLIAAVAHRVVVVEAAERSGSLNTASHARALGRDLSAVISRPQDDHNAGCYRLVEEWGADEYLVKNQREQPVKK